MRIAYVVSHINSSTQWVWFSEELQKRNIPFIFIIINDYDPLLFEDLKKRNVTVYFLKHSGKLSLFSHLTTIVRLFRKHKINLVHSEMPYGNLLGQTAALICKIKMRVTTCENTTWFFDFKSIRQEFIDVYTYLIVKKIIALAHESFEFLYNHFKLSPRRLTIIGHSLKTSEYKVLSAEERLQIREELQIAKDDFIIGMVARFEFWKGHLYAIKAMEKLSKEFPNAKLLIFGSKGDSYNNMMKQIKRRNLENHVIYKGFVHNNISLYGLFDVHLHIPIKLRSETFGINIIEGMAAGTAQVLTLSGISKFTARDGSNCLVVPYKSASKVYEALKRLITDPELRLRLGQQAREDVLKHFRYEDKVEQHLNLYNELKKETGS